MLDTNRPAIDQIEDSNLEIAISKKLSDFRMMKTDSVGRAAKFYELEHKNIIPEIGTGIDFDIFMRRGHGLLDMRESGCVRV